MTSHSKIKPPLPLWIARFCKVCDGRDDNCDHAILRQWLHTYTETRELICVVTTPDALMRMPRVPETGTIPDGFSYKYFNGYKGQPWNIVYCKCGALLWRYIIEGERGLRRSKIGQWELLTKLPFWGLSFGDKESGT